MNENENGIDWNLTTWEGSRREQLRRHCRLTLRQKLEALDDMREFALRFRELRENRGASSTGSKGN